MSKQVWNTFVATHPKAICVFGAVIGKDVKGALDRRGMQLPTAYGLTVEVLKKVLKDDWAIQRATKSFHLLLSTSADLALLGKIVAVGPASQRPLPAPCAVAYSFVFDGQLYQRWAAGLGYVI